MTDYKDETAEAVINQLKKDCTLTEKDEAEIKQNVRNIINELEVFQISQFQKALMNYQQEFKVKHKKIITV